MDKENNSSLDWNLKGAIAMELGNLIARYNRYSLHGRQGSFEAYKSLKQIRLILSAYIEDKEKFQSIECKGDEFFNTNDFINQRITGFQTREQYFQTTEGKKDLEKLKELDKSFNLTSYSEEIMLLLKELGFSFGTKSDSSQMRM